jgi:hypothetical protein
VVLDGFLHQAQLSSNIAIQAVDAFSSEFPCIGTNENGWTLDLKGGNYGTDYLLRSTLTRFGFATNIAADAVPARPQILAAPPDRRRELRHLLRSRPNSADARILVDYRL